MNKLEFGSKIADFILGRRVQGKISAVLETSEVTHSRYVVQTQKGLFTIQLESIDFRGVGPLVEIVVTPIFQRGEIIDRRIRHVTPWINGQIV